MDIRWKLFSMVLISIAIFKAEVVLLFPTAVLFIILAKLCKITFSQLISDLKFFFFLMFMIFLSRSVSMDGNIIFKIFHINFTDKGMVTGSVLALKFFLVMLLGIFFIRSTKSFEIKKGVAFILKPLPFVPHNRVAVMTSLFIKFFSIIPGELSNVIQALEARSFHLVKNPVKRIVMITFPALKRTFQRADELVDAMEARSYSEDRTESEFTQNGLEKIIIPASILIFILSLFI